jgi:hypothetical protein
MGYKKAIAGAMLIMGIFSALLLSNSQVRFHSDDPLMQDPDRNPVPMPKKRKLSQIYDLVENTWILRPKDDEEIPVSQNTNTLGEVPDSSWFTNRMSRRIMGIEELIRGPNQLGDVDGHKPWALISVKTEGVTPGFTVRNTNGDVFYVKFDPPDNPQMSTSTEAIATKFFYAFGYNVPQNYLTFMRQQDLEISPEAELTDENGVVRPVNQEDLRKIFDRIYQGPDAKTPAIASLRLDGEDLGPFRYHGTRRDDPNDIFPHEHRRELRGLRLFAAWLNHDDSRSINTIDFYEGEPGDGFVRHYLMDFGSCLGSGSIKVQSRRAGNEYMVEFMPIFKAAISFGIWDRPWRHVKYPDYPAIGRFEGDFFKPEKWRPEYPNPAFERMLPEDAFWAARIILRFSDEMIRAIVKTGKIADPEAEDYLVRTLIKRRDKIIRHYLPQTSPLDEFRIEREGASNSLNFVNLMLTSGLSDSDVYEYEWFQFDNLTGTLTKLIQSTTTSQTRIPVPQGGSEYIMVRIQSEGTEKSPQHSIDIYLRDQANPKIVGIER